MSRKIILHSRYEGWTDKPVPMLLKYGGKVVHYRRKTEVKAFSEWLDATYPIRYKDIKEGDHFILWNGDSMPVPFVQMKDERPDKYNRPTRLNDGCYLGLDADMRVTLAPKEDVVALAREIRGVYA